MAGRKLLQEWLVCREGFSSARFIWSTHRASDWMLHRCWATPGSWAITSDVPIGLLIQPHGWMGPNPSEGAEGRSGRGPRVWGVWWCGTGGTGGDVFFCTELDASTVVLYAGCMEACGRILYQNHSLKTQLCSVWMMDWWMNGLAAWWFNGGWMNGWIIGWMAEWVE